MTRQNVMWNGTCAHLGYAEQLEATRLSGCEVLTITPQAYARRRAQGLSASDIRSMAEDAGVRVDHLDPIARWAPAWLPEEPTSKMVEALGTSVDDFFTIADELGCESLSAICSFPHGEVPIEQLIESFAELCRRADGRRVDLEFIPIWGLPDLRTAWRVVEGAGAANGGILLDFWHFFRSRSDLSLLRAIPAEKIHSVQACDAKLMRAAGRTDWEDIHEDRCPLGRGEFDFDELLAVLAEKDALRVVGPEYFSSEMVGLSPREVAEVVENTYWPHLEPYGVAPSPREEN